MLAWMLKRRFLRPLAMATLFAVAGPQWGAAESRDETAVRKLAQEADLVVIGTCEASKSRWDPEAGVILTRSEVRLRQTFKGRATAQTLTVETLGGTVDGVTMAASDAARLDTGETVVLFLRRSRSGAHHVVWGGRRGKLPVRVARTGEDLIGGGAGVDAQTFATWIDASER